MLHSLAGHTQNDVLADGVTYGEDKGDRMKPLATILLGLGLAGWTAEADPPDYKRIDQIAQEANKSENLSKAYSIVEKKETVVVRETPRNGGSLHKLGGFGFPSPSPSAFYKEGAVSDFGSKFYGSKGSTKETAASTPAYENGYSTPSHEKPVTKTRKVTLVDGRKRPSDWSFYSLSFQIVNLSQNDTNSEVADWMSRPGLVGVIHRSSMGIDGTDTAFVNRCSDAVGKNYRWGAYHYLRASGDAKAQARWFLKRVLAAPRHQKQILLAVDAEYLKRKDGTVISYPEISKVIEFVQTIKELTGVYPGVYTGQDFLKEKFKTAGLSAGDAEFLDEETWLWIARYGQASQLHFPEVSAPPWSGWTMWQVSDSDNPSPLYEGMKAEVNAFKGDSSAVADFWDKHSWDYQTKERL
jgi:GH25 family lysozyme M1 (1,4-beta-N-acetylmuramidase)